MTIRILPPQLANQIAAGEVVERPASVVKELVENSLDAGATRIDIEIEKGGSKLIRVRDNGSGVAEHELVLALSRHATSKIADLSDLESITSLGFRGEALASISSVSRLTLTSRPETQEAAWQASAAGRDMEVEVKPAAHPVGTSIEVVDLFFNTPARRKFLRTDKTEFAHIDELVKRLALSRYDVSWTLTHNGQQLRRLKAAETGPQQLKRVAALCGRQFADKAAYIENSYGDVRLWGWLLHPDACGAQPGCQYSYVNGRMMRDKLLNHAIRQAYGELLLPEQQPAFVLYLELDPRQVDVNVHPAKHEVRFHQARLVHDFVVSALSDALQQLVAEVQPKMESARPLPLPDTAAAAYQVNEQKAWPVLSPTERNSGYRPAVPERASAGAVKQQLSYLAQQHDAVAADKSASLPATGTAVSQPGQEYLIAANRYLLQAAGHQIMLIDLALTAARSWHQKGSSAAPLLMPLRIALNAEEKQQWLACAEAITHYGFNILLQNDTAIIRAVPEWLRQTALSQWLPRGGSLLAGDLAGCETLLIMLLDNNWLAAETLVTRFSDILTAPGEWVAVPLQLTDTLARFSDAATV
ncbi:DNA mismatch repair endonuclease MutL [Chromatiaceae bacterium AAb-1]|nr:DNA mismatch repair endonuclease MutL [Chromatiaceae bacterium AAb-1]